MMEIKYYKNGFHFKLLTGVILTGHTNLIIKYLFRNKKVLT